MKRVVAILSFVALLACGRDSMSRDEWRRLPRENRVLYVQTLIAEEKAKDAKGGRGRTMERPPEEYVNEIDAAYARGDRRDVDNIFEGLR